MREDVIKLKQPTPEQLEKLKEFFKLNSVYGVLSSDTYDKLKQVEEEYIDARLHDKTDPNTVL